MILVKGRFLNADAPIDSIPSSIFRVLNDPVLLKALLATPTTS